MRHFLSKNAVLQSKTSTPRGRLSLLAMLGVCSVFFSQESKAYPVSKSSFSNRSTYSADIEKVKMLRSSGETPEAEPTESKKVVAPMSPGSHNLSVGLGQVFLFGDLGNSYENALGFQARYDYGVSDLFAFDSEFGYSSHSNGNFSTWHLTAGLRTNLVYLEQLVPFFSVGLGFYRPSFTYSTAANDTASSLLFGLQLGAGLDLFLTNSVFFGTKLTFHDMFNSTKAVNGVNRDLGGTFMTFLIHAGVAF